MQDNNNNNHYSNKYDPNAVISAANASPDLDGGRFIFQSALLEWVDDAREGGRAGDEGVREAVATLWLALAQYLMQSKQYKSATETLDEAVQCPVAASVGRVHAEAARFARERGKRKTAQNIYVNALQKQVVTDEQDRELLWNDFLELMRETNPELTLQALQEAVEREATAEAAASSAFQQQQEGTTGIDDNGPAAKRLKQSDLLEFNQQQQQQQQKPESSQTHVVTMDNVEHETKRFAEAYQFLNHGKDPSHQLPPEIMAAWMTRDGNYPPQPPEYALFAPSPPKLSDPVSCLGSSSNSVTVIGFLTIIFFEWDSTSNRPPKTLSVWTRPYSWRNAY